MLSGKIGERKFEEKENDKEMKGEREKEIWRVRESGKEICNFEMRCYKKGG